MTHISTPASSFYKKPYNVASLTKGNKKDGFWKTRDPYLGGVSKPFQASFAEHCIAQVATASASTKVSVSSLLS
jgi:hypothetical protein